MIRSMPYSWRRLATLACALALLGGCALSGNPRRAAPAATYRLQALSADLRAEGPAQPVVIRLLPVDAAPGLGGASMLYSTAPARLQPYRDSRWLAPPAELLRNALAQTLAAQPWVAAVDQNAAVSDAPWLLHCELARLEHDVAPGTGSRVRLGLGCELARRGGAGLAGHWRLDLEQPVEVDDAPHYAQAAQALLERALRELVPAVAERVRD